METLSDLKNLLTQHKDELISQFKITEIGIFGSYAQSKQTADSDIDIIVEFQNGAKTFDNYMGLKLHLEELFGKNVDLVLRQTIREELKPSILSGTIYVF